MKIIIKLVFAAFFLLNVNAWAQSFIVDVKTKVPFNGTVLYGPLTSAQLQKFATAPITGGGQFRQGFKGSLDKHVVHNCDEYWRYGLHPNNTYEISMTSFFIKNCGILAALMQAKQPQKSYIHGISLSQAQWLSPLLLPTVVRNDELTAYQKQNLSIAHLIQMGKVKFAIKSPYEIVITYNTLKETIDEIARADFNGDGLESILASVITTSTQGSYRSYEVTTITRNRDEKLLHIVPLIKRR